MAVPVGSHLVVRATGDVRLDIAPKGGLEAAKADPKEPLPKGAAERRFAIKGDGSASLRGVGGGNLTWAFTAIPDRPPTIALIKPPERQARGSLRLDYKLEDDYGVVDAQADFALKDDAREAPAGDAAASAVQGARNAAHAAAGAHAQRPRADHPRSHRAPLGRRRGHRHAGRA